MALLDTAFLIDLMKEAKAFRVGPASRMRDMLLAQDETLRIAIFTMAELQVGIDKGSQPERERRAIEECLTLFEILPFEQSTAHIFGTVVGTLEKAGQTISDMDALIASVALEHGKRLVTRKVQLFERIPGLTVAGYWPFSACVPQALAGWTPSSFSASSARCDRCASWLPFDRLETAGSVGLRSASGCRAGIRHARRFGPLRSNRAGRDSGSLCDPTHRHLLPAGRRAVQRVQNCRPSFGIRDLPSSGVEHRGRGYRQRFK